MYYQAKLFPIGPADEFASVVCHGEHKVGGEDTREVHQARVRVGKASTPKELNDLSDLVFPPLAASPSRVRHMTQMARGQGELARSGAYSASTSEHYAANELAMVHAARLAAEPSIRVPRLVHGIAEGRVLCGFEPAIEATSGEQLPGVLALFDLRTASGLGAWVSSRQPLVAPRTGVERFSSVQIGRPLGLSRDGSRVLIADRMHAIECLLDEQFTETIRLPLGHAKLLPVRNGWVGIQTGKAQRFDERGKVIAQLSLPEDAVYWGCELSKDEELLVMPSLKNGEFWVLPWNGSMPRRFTPHRGVARDSTARVALSPDGQWIASHCNGALVLTNLAEGESMHLAPLSAQELSIPSFNQYVIRSHVPAAFAFVGNTLLVSQGDDIVPIDIDCPSGSPFTSEVGRVGARTPVRIAAGMDFQSLLAAAGLERRSDALKAVHSPGARIETYPLGKAGWALFGPKAPEMGASRFGGWPDLRSGSVWPQWVGRPMAFLAQINLADAHAAVPGLRLPKQGLISFFLGCGSDAYAPHDDSRERYMVDLLAGTESKTNDAWRVIFDPDATDLVRLQCKETVLPELFQPCALEFRTGALALPDENAVAYEVLDLDAEERQRFNEVIEHLVPHDERCPDQLMGYPRLIQSTPPELMCELSATGRNPWQIPMSTDADFPPLARSASDWGLLLQLTSNPDADFCWGDAGHFYFFGKRETMERGDFSGVWVNFEN